MQRNRPIEPEDESSAPILREDQDRINEFARLNLQKTELQRKRDALAKEKELLDDASNEAMLQMDEDGLRVKAGDCFFPISSEDLESFLAKEQVSTDGAIAAIDAEMAKYSERMDALKVVLYAKFGRSIRLDVDDE